MMSSHPEHGTADATRLIEIARAVATRGMSEKASRQSSSFETPGSVAPQDEGEALEFTPIASC
jgi:hypothetical protein